MHKAVFEDMKRLGITPTMKSHMLLLCAYSKTGNVAKCEYILNQIHKAGLKPDTFVINNVWPGFIERMEGLFQTLPAMAKVY
ncbi:hypothetical protein Pint_16823 [Pistacia integerrima]|uniref:Uncharacterized protein n=1 Tax=Pistacia integerrima TaxID=434235 RepID=A0ACC0ZB92_9ROSI|nr:hypothetical protein Pint_16823 [Pistacia integerrima]